MTPWTKEAQDGFFSKKECKNLRIDRSILNDLHSSYSAMIMFAQYVQGSTFGQVVKMAEAVTDFAKRCTDVDRDNPNCQKPLDRIFLNTICQEDNLPRFTDCCAKKDPERNDCFLSLKNSSRGFISPFERPNAEAACKNYSEHRHSLPGYEDIYLCFSFIYDVSRRHPFLYAPTILSVAIHYDEMMKDCCRSTEDSTHNLEECFRRQVLQSKVWFCSMRPVAFPSITIFLRFRKLVQISQKFPKADFFTVTKLVSDIANMHKDCCRGDMLECMRDREEILHYVCTNQDIISSKIKKCCEKPLLQRSECIVNAENDDKPANLSPQVREFIEDKGICERFAQEKDTHLARFPMHTYCRFLYEYSRRHPEFSAQMLLRIGKGYEDLLDECCKTGSPDNCCSRGEEELKKHIYETESVMKTSCDIYKEKGDYYFQNELLLSFTKKMPQLTSAELIKFTKQMTTIGSKCCQLSQDKLLPCAEENVSLLLFFLLFFVLFSYIHICRNNMKSCFSPLPVKLDLVLGEICRRHLTNPINPAVCHCCSSSYALRRPCMGKLEIDENYVPLSLTPDLFTFHEDLCTTEEEKLQHKKQESVRSPSSFTGLCFPCRMLINLIKYKPQITQEQLTSITVAFTAMREQCCKEENREACFVKEGPELIKRSEKLLSA
ncbi:alpha-fetoprotein-like [Phasianus colchicus]|uniref:alpha-fetoprotein-like n=1 Tax=Phasianus colchicus TaxID=9054 RepID=UPI00129DBF76|nr:alpha-fetoprotein-like [Phasianus colchicus]